MKKIGGSEILLFSKAYAACANHWKAQASYMIERDDGDIPEDVKQNMLNALKPNAAKKQSTV